MKIGVITPHRNDRPEFLAQFKKYLAAQTLQPDVVLYADKLAKSDVIDITKRYREAYAEMIMIADVVLFMEVDDYYASNYIEKIVAGWNDAGQPDIFGIDSSIYYHVTGRWFQIGHPGRSSANTTLLKTGLQINWPADNYPYTDIVLWDQLKGKTMPMPRTPICIGIKHGIGLVGGGAHNSDSGHYKHEDPTGEWLSNIIGEDSEFYKELKRRL